MHEEVVRREAEAGVQPAAVEQQQPGRRAGIGVDVDLDLVGAIAGDEPQRRAVAGPSPLARSTSAAVLVAQPRRVADVPGVEAPLHAHPAGEKSSENAKPCGPAVPRRLGDRQRRIAAVRRGTSRRWSTRSARAASAGPASGSPSRRRGRPSTSGRRHLRPACRGPCDHQGSSRRARAHDRVVGRVLPRPVDRSRSRRHDHVAGRRPGGAALGQHHVVVVAAPQDLRALLREPFDDQRRRGSASRRRPSPARRPPTGRRRRSATR